MEQLTKAVLDSEYKSIGYTDDTFTRRPSNLVRKVGDSVTVNKLKGKIVDIDPFSSYCYLVQFDGKKSKKWLRSTDLKSKPTGDM